MPGKKLLVADDSLTIQKVIRLALTNEGYEIQTVPDGTDAVQQISLFRPDVVLIDVSLPGKSAFEVKREINQHEDLAEVRFILMSSAFEKVDEAQAQEVTFHGRLTKPFDPAHLRQVLTEGLEQVTARRMEKTTFMARPATETPKVSAQTTPPSPPTFFPPNQSETISIFPPLTAIASPASSPLPPPPPSFAPKNEATDTSPFSDPPLGDFGSTNFQEDFPSNFQPETSGSLNPMAPEKTASLWEPGEDLTSSLIPPPPPSPPSSSPPFDSNPQSGIPENFPDTGNGPESDIKSLTESTIRSTGLDDYEWSVNEPTLRPLPAMRDLDGTTFQVEPPHFEADPGTSAGSLETQMASERRRSSEEEMPPFIPQKAEAMGTPVNSFLSDRPTPLPQKEYTTPQESSTYESSGTPASPTHFQAGPIISGMSAAQMEALVKDQVHALLEKMAQQLLPDMAEKIIKDEIHKMLSETS